MSTPGEITEVELPKPAATIGFVYLARGVGIALFALPMLCLSTILVRQPGLAVLLWFGLCAGGILLLYWLQRSSVRAVAHDIELSDPGAALVQLCRQTSAGSEQHCWPVVSRRLADAGRFGLTIRVRRGGEIDVADPIVVPFEPRPLADIQPEDSELTPRSTDFETASRKTVSGAFLVRDAGIGQRRISGAQMITTIFPAGLVYVLVTSYTSTFSLSGFFIGSVVFFTIFLVMGGWRSLRNPTSQILVVPGGLVHRRSSWWSREWRVHVFDRREAVWLSAWRRKDLWDVSVADAETFVSFWASDVQFKFALRAWLSPLEPPAVEVLSDLA